MYLSMKASRVVLRGVRLREEPLTQYLIRNSLKYGRFATLNIPGSLLLQKAVKRSTHVLKLCTFPSRLMAEITRNRNGHTRSVKCSHFGIFSVVN